MLVKLLLVLLAIWKGNFLRGKFCHALDDVEQSIETSLLPQSSGSTLGTKTINLGETLKLDDLGPIIINADGTTRRIANWDKLTKFEQESTWRRISERNKKRIEDLQRKQSVEKDM